MSQKKNPLKIILIVIVLAALIFGLMKSGALEYLKDREKLETLIKGLGVWGPIAYIGMYALVTITCISVLPLTLAGGLIFGAIM
ncbi:MAG: hypothetical protein RR682_04350 [Cetobacterium sp.]